ncbi:DDE superfamily endonuclease [Popillia japonica]|uniref:DDE superfamily endonuclease n=1 Tax=Popillia japonica TaxID=7064 RepID=A0AAW1IYX8_POPJA
MYMKNITPIKLNLDFRHHFRLTKTACEVVLNKIGEKLHTSEIKRGRPPNDVKQQVLVSLWMLANQETYRQLADKFDITISMAWDYFRRTVNAVVSIVQDVIQWPKLEQDRKRISLQFYPRQSFPGVIGAIDGTHIPIVAPSHMQNLYINRNKYHSIILQGICSADYKFIDCYVGPPGSIHDTRVLRMSPLGRKLTDSQNIILPEYHLLGDSAYPNTTFLITAYNDT